MSSLQAHAAPRAEHSANENEEEKAEHSANNNQNNNFVHPDSDIEIDFEREIEFYSSNDVNMIDDRLEKHDQLPIQELLPIHESFVHPYEQAKIDLWNTNPEYWYTLFLVDGELVRDSRLLLNKTENCATGESSDNENIVAHADNEADDSEEEESATADSESSANSSETADDSEEEESATADSESSANSSETAAAESRLLVENEMRRVSRLGQKVRQRLVSLKKKGSIIPNSYWFKDDFELGLLMRKRKRKRERDAANSNSDDIYDSNEQPTAVVNQMGN